jgi:hypothetical protein
MHHCAHAFPLYRHGPQCAYIRRSHDGRHFQQGGIADTMLRDERVQRDSLAMSRQFGTGYHKRDGVFSLRPRQRVFMRREKKFRVGVKKTPDEPCARDTVHANPLSREPFHGA